MEKLFFDSGMSLLRILIVGTLAYGSLVVMLRISGKRTLSKMNAFDLVVTVALGSTLSTVILSKDVALLEGLLALGLLIFLQFVLSWVSVRSSTFSSLVKAEPKLLVYQGHYLWQEMRKERITQEEILTALRKKGLDAIEHVDAVVLETAGSLSIIPKLPPIPEQPVLSPTEPDMRKNR